MRVEATKQAASGQTGAFRRGETQTAHAPRQSESRALIATTPPPAYEAPANFREAAFLAHLIATKDRAPQTRERRRAEPSEAMAAYRAAAALTRV